MNFTHAVVFYDENKPPLKLRGDQYMKLKILIKKEQFIEIGEDTYNRSDIRRIEKIKEEKLMLPPPDPPPITHEKLIEIKNALIKKFTWN